MNGYTKLRSVPSNIYISKQPQNWEGHVGDTFTLSVVVVCPEDYEVYYQWQYSYDLENWAPTTINSSAQTSTLVAQMTPGQDHRYYRCLVGVTPEAGSSVYYELISSPAMVSILVDFTFSYAVSWLGQNVFTPIFNFVTPWGFTFGALIVGIFGAPLLVKAYKKFF